MKYYGQLFAFKLPTSLKLINLAKENNNITLQNKELISEELGMGIPKVETLLQYLGICGIIKNKELTYLGKKIIDMDGDYDFIEPLIYYGLVKNPKKNGHYIYSSLVNDTLYNFWITGIENVKKQSLLKENMSNNIRGIGNWDKLNGVALGTLTNTQNGFGKMGILEKLEDKDQYEIHSYWVEPLIGAYILYDMWNDHQTSMGITNIVNDKYNLGRMFLMDEEAIEETLGEIQALGLIDIEKGAGLNQIRIKKRYTKEDILDMIIREV